MCVCVCVCVRVHVCVCVKVPLVCVCLVFVCTHLPLSVCEFMSCLSLQKLILLFLIGHVCMVPKLNPLCANREQEVHYVG